MVRMTEVVMKKMTAAPINGLRVITGGAARTLVAVLRGEVTRRLYPLHYKPKA